MLGAPEPITQDELNARPRSWDAHCIRQDEGNLQGDAQFSFFDGKALLSMSFFDGKLPGDITQEEKDSLVQVDRFVDGLDRKAQVFMHNPDGLDLDELGDKEFEEGSYCIAPLRCFAEDESQPISINVDDCVHLLQHNRVLFYTGAGMSAASDVWMLEELLENLGVRTHAWWRKAMQQPDQVLSTFSSFCNAAFENPPTAAHIALTSLAQCCDAKVCTENFDFLHERTGIDSIRMSSSWLREHVTPAMLQEVDVVICIGMSADDRGFLGWYKEHNPNGKIVSIDLKKPSYLGSDDCLLLGDLQEVLPLLASKISAMSS